MIETSIEFDSICLLNKIIPIRGRKQEIYAILKHDLQVGKLNKIIPIRGRKRFSELTPIIQTKVIQLNKIIPIRGRKLSDKLFRIQYCFTHC